MPKALNQTRISGTISLYQDNPFVFINYIVGTKIRIFNEKYSYLATTDQNGVFEIWNLPSGKYKILPETPLGFAQDLVLSKGEIEFKRISDLQVDTKDFKVEIKPRGCGGADYVFNKRQ